MKFNNLIWVTFAALAVSACDVAQTGSGQSISSGEPPSDFTGVFTSGESCNAAANALSIRGSEISQGGITCQIRSARYINSSATEYTLKDCVSGETPQSDRMVMVSEVEDGQILVTGWGDRATTFDVCG